jgi:molybdopterin synthase sulfur carrier subunit
MILTVKYFGAVADITQKKEEQLHFESDTISLNLVQSKLEQLYPEIKNTKYSFAVNQLMTKEDAIVNNNDEIALLPPFSGG